MASQRRSQTASSSHVNKAPNVMEDWEAKAPLNESEIKSVNVLKGLCEERKLPLKFFTEELSTRPSTPISKNNFARPSTLSTPSRPSTPLSRPEIATTSGHYLHPKYPIQTPEQFHDWFALLERSVTHSQDAHFRAHLDGISSHRISCENLLDIARGIESKAQSMLVEWRSVEEGGRSLKDACEKLLQEKDRLLAITEAISLRLEYFQELEHATRMLNHPGDSLVLQSDFLLMVERVDVCLEFLRSHEDFREAEIYLLRFQQCLTRAMTLIKMFFVGSLRALLADISHRISDKDLSATAHLHLLYSKFVSASYQVAPLLAELEKRAEQYPNEIASLLTECHTAYLATRKSLLIPKLVEDIKGLDPSNCELVELTRTGCTYMRQLCLDEFEVYSCFFNTGEAKLYNYLESICDYLFDDLRPRILHEPRLNILCEVCTVIQALMALDLPPSGFSSMGIYGDDEDTEAFTNATNRRLGKFQIRPILQMLLQDAQTRLLFKAQAVMESDIRSYKPKPDDLLYPGKLTEANSSRQGGPVLLEKQRKWFSDMPPVSDQTIWYPTLQKTLWVLSQLHDFVKPEVFYDIACEAISLCRHSLKAAADIISSRPPVESRYDGLLFLIRHLLLLRDIANSLERTEQNVPERPTSVGSVLRGTTALLSSTGLLGGGMGITKVNEDADVRIGIDRELKSACEELIERRSVAATRPIREFLERCDAFHNGRVSMPTLSLPDQQFMKPADIIQNYVEFRMLCEKETAEWMSQLQLYLKDPKSISVLMAPYQMKVAEVYSSFRDLISREYPAEVLEQLMSTTELWNLLNKLCSI